VRNYFLGGKNACGEMMDVGGKNEYGEMIGEGGYACVFYDIVYFLLFCRL
jgi:hypothetical protein